MKPTPSLAAALLLLPQISGSKPSQSRLRKLVQDGIDSDSIGRNLEFLAAEPHLAGSYRDEVVLAGFISDHFEKYTDEVEKISHKVKLSYTRNGADDLLHKRNKVQILSNEGNGKSGEAEKAKVVYDAQLTESFRADGSNVNVTGHDIPDLWLAGTPAGTVTGQPIYVNYGRESDFEDLCATANQAHPGLDLCRGEDFNVGKFPDLICVMRYGKIFRGSKIKHAQEHGCLGAILFTDPEQYARQGENVNVYPEGINLPAEGAERGSAVLMNGDYRTPGYPSDPEGNYHRRESPPEIKIVAQNIGYGTGLDTAPEIEVYSTCISKS